MAGANVSPNTIGGRFTNVAPFLPQPVVTSQNGGRITQASFTGSGSATNPDSLFINNGSTTIISGNWIELPFSQGLKQTPWTPYPGWDNFSAGSCEPHLGLDNYFYPDPNPPTSYNSGTFGYFDNEWNGGEAGPCQSAVRSGNEWVAVPNDPQTNVTDTGSVKASIANQFNLTPPYPGSGIPISTFNSIMSYNASADPLVPPSANPLIHYDSSWDIFGYAHYEKLNQITFEIMFWTRNFNQGPFGFTETETGIDFGDGKLWDLWISNGTVSDGGVADEYSYGIFLLEEPYQTDMAWVNILAGVRYFAMHYVKTSGPSAPANPLDIPLIQIIRGWESCSTNYTPLAFRNLDYRLVIT